MVELLDIGGRWRRVVSFTLPAALSHIPGEYQEPVCVLISHSSSLSPVYCVD